MSYSVVGPGRAGPGEVTPRPGIVGWASLLLFGAAMSTLALGALGAMESLQRRTMPLTYPDGTTAPSELTDVTASVQAVGVAGICLLLATGLVALGVLVRKGNQPARIVTWVLAGLMVPGCGCGLLVDIFGAALLREASAQRTGVLADIDTAIPVWMTVVSTVLTSLILASLLAVIVLLAMPSANDYFRRDVEVWQPPTWPVGGYPPMPPPVSGPPRL